MKTDVSMQASDTLVPSGVSAVSDGNVGAVGDPKAALILVDVGNEAAAAHGHSAQRPSN